MTAIEAARLAAAIAILRPDWPEPSLRTFLDRPELSHRPLHDVAVVLAWIATDPASKTPARALERGPWWQTVAVSTADPSPPIPPCPTHGGATRRPDGTYGCCHAHRREAGAPAERKPSPPPKPLRQLVGDTHDSGAAARRPASERTLDT